MAGNNDKISISLQDKALINHDAWKVLSGLNTEFCQPMLQNDRNYYKLRNVSPSCKALIPFTDLAILLELLDYSSSSFI